MLRNLNLKVLFCLFFLVFPPTPFVIEIQAEEDIPVGISEESKLRFAAWNLQFLGHNNPINAKIKGKDEFKTIARILNKYDFIAIIELMPDDVKNEKSSDGKIELEDNADLKKILKKLRKNHGRKFKYLISPQVGWKGGSYQEHYAFLYDEKINVVPEGEKGNTNGSLYHLPVERPEDRMEVTDKFSRPPFWATFRAGNFDFTVIAVHLYYGPQKPNEKRKRSIAERRNEIRELAKVYNKVQDMDEQENDVLLVGDFNMPPSDISFADLKNKAHKVTPLFHIKNGDVSNLAKTPMLYDNIFFQQKHLNEYLDSCIDKFHLTYFGGNKKAARMVSDHLPVWAEFRIDLEDDDPEGNSQ